MLLKTKGIIFRTVKYRETSLILDIYTRDLGLRTYIISGVRKAKARTSAALLQVMNLVDLVVYENEGKELNRIKEVKAAQLYGELPFKVQKSSVGIFMLEIARRSIRENEANIPLFDFLWKSFLHLDQTKESIANYHISFLIELSKKIGFYPEANYSETNEYFDMREGVFTGYAPIHKDYIKYPLSKELFKFLGIEIKDSHLVSLDKKTRSDLLTSLVDYYRIHLEDLGPVRSLQIFNDIFS